MARRCALAFALGLSVLLQTFAASGALHAAEGDCRVMGVAHQMGDAGEGHGPMGQGSHAAHGMAADGSEPSADVADDDGLCLGCDATGACGAAPGIVAASAVGFDSVRDHPAAADAPTIAEHRAGSLRRPPRLI
jgi:hypothetical protein